jgi:peptidoglycan/LPS O-acetylase OafA/YrhL
MAEGKPIGHDMTMPDGDQPELSGDVEKRIASLVRTPLPNAAIDNASTVVTGEDGRFLPSGEEAGTPPEDRAFRPDVLGLRAIAVLLVVLVHAQVSFLLGGFIGVDVFFVISGFVITGLLLRERSFSGRIDVLDFYARRVRRILPAAMLVLVVAVIAERVLIGTSVANYTTTEARWAALFLANFPHNNANFFHPLPDPLGAYWSLAVEEQFYLVYPLIVFVVAAASRRLGFRMRLGIVLALIFGGSLGWSVISSPGAGTVVAYASPFTHAWELAFGGLLALGGRLFLKLPVPLAATATWIGLGALGAAAVAIKGPGASGYPGYVAAWPVAATGLIIAGGTAAPRWGAEALLGLTPVGWLGLWSFSIYLWHYPILIVAGQYWGHTTVATNLLLAVVAVALSAATYYIVENPIRRSRRLARAPGISVLGGIGVIAAIVAVLAV